MARKPPAQPRKPTLNTPAPTTRGDNDPDTHTIADYIIRQLELGADLYSAAGSAGIPAPLIQTWMNNARIQWTRATTSNDDWARDFTPEEQDLAIFYERVSRAVSVNRSRSALLLEQHVRGGTAKTRTRTKSRRGQIVERLEETETLLPNFDALKFKLERLHPEVYGPRATLTLNVSDVSDRDDVGRELEAAMQAVAKQLALETTATEGDPSANGDDDHED